MVDGCQTRKEGGKQRFSVTKKRGEVRRERLLKFVVAVLIAWEAVAVEVAIQIPIASCCQRSSLQRIKMTAERY